MRRWSDVNVSIIYIYIYILFLGEIRAYGSITTNNYSKQWDIFVNKLYLKGAILSSLSFRKTTLHNGQYVELRTSCTCMIKNGYRGAKSKLRCCFFFFFFFFFFFLVIPWGHKNGSARHPTLICIFHLILHLWYPLEIHRLPSSFLSPFTPDSTTPSAIHSNQVEVLEVFYLSLKSWHPYLS